MSTVAVPSALPSMIRWPSKSSSDPWEGQDPDPYVCEVWKKSWERIRERDWETFHLMGAPAAEFIFDSVGENPRHFFRVALSLAKNIQRPPCVTIKIEGDPAVMLMIARIIAAREAPWQRRQQELHDAADVFDA